MMTIRSHDQFNTHIYGLDDRYRGVYNGRRVIFMNAEDMKPPGLHEGRFVDLTSHFGESEERTARHFQVVPYRYSTRLHRDLFPGDECARPDQQRGRALQYADQQVCHHLRRSIGGDVEYLMGPMRTNRTDVPFANFLS